MIVDRARGPVEDVSFDGAARARPTPEALGALAAADSIVIGPSNPIASIGPVLALPGMREAIAAAPAPVVAVSPFVGGRAIKGPTEAFAAWGGLEADAAGVARAYAGLLDGLVVDEEVELEDVPSLRTDTLMDTPAARARVAATILEFAGALTGRGRRRAGDAR
jgi:LPPG:FO 2-phospho-L-lactate transferase